MSKEKYTRILLDYLEKYKHLPDQGSLEWINSRKQTIGGSEIGTIAGTNYYGKGDKGIGDLVANKIGLKPFVKNIWMRMGNLCEDIVRQYAELVFDTNIYETGCIPGRTNSNDEVVQTFSPDGLGVTEIEKVIDYFRDSYPDVEKYLRSMSDDYNISLFEFKAPGCRIPLDGWESKTEGYHSQVLDGLDTIPIVSFGIYVDAVIRRCSLYNLGHNQVWNPVSYMQKMRDLGSAQYCGFIGIYHVEGNASAYKPNEEDPDLDDYIKELFKNKPSSEDFRSWLQSAQRGANYFKAQEPDLIDFGACDYGQFESMLINVVDKKCWGMYHSKLYKPGDANLFEELGIFEDTYNAIGYVPWKLFNVEIIPVIPQVGFVDNLMDKISEVIENIKYINGNGNEEEFEIQERFYELYPQCKSRSKSRTMSKPKVKATTDAAPLLPSRKYSPGALQELLKF